MLLSLVMTVAAINFCCAQDCLYIVGNLTDWKYPHTTNAEFYEKFKLQKVDEYQGYPIFQGAFDVSSLYEAPVFRFYTDLQGWETNSLGSQYDDEALGFSLAEMEDGVMLVQGKGSFEIFNWSGNTLYVTVWNNKVWASDTKCYDPNEIVLNDYTALTLCPGEEGIYYTSLYTSSNSIKVKGSVVGRPEVKWLYVSPKGSIDTDKYGIAISDIEYLETPVSFNCDVPEFGSGWRVYVDLINNKIYFNNGETKWLGGSFNDCPVITFMNYKDYDQYLLSTRTGNKIQNEIPEGPISIFLSTPSFGVDYSNSVKWNVEQQPSFYPTFFINSIKLDWPGGTLVSSYHVLGWIKSLDEMYAWTFQENMTPVKLEKKSSGLFEGIVEFPAGNNENFISISFQNKTQYAPSLSPGNARPLFSDKNTVITSDYDLEPRYSSTYFAQFIDGAKIKVSVDRSKNTISYAVEEGEVLTLPLLTWENQDNGSEQGNFAIVNKDTFVADFTTQSESDIALFSNLCIETTDGSVMIPEWNAGVNDGLGTITYPFSLVKTNNIPEAAYLPISGPYNTFSGMTSFQVNMAKKELTVFQSDASYTDNMVDEGFKLPKCLYMYGKVKGQDNMTEFNAFTGGPIDYNLSNSRNNILTLTSYDSENACGVYEGIFSLADELPTVYTNMYINLYPANSRYFNSPSIICMDILRPENNDVFLAEQSLIFPYSDRAFAIDTTNAPSQDYGIRIYIYGKNHTVVTVDNGASSVKDIEISDVETLKIVGQEGSIRIESIVPETINIYSVTGTMLRNVRIPAGTAIIDGFLPGIYIVNGQKVLVR